MENKIVIVRALWGSTERALNEVFSKPVFSNEVVYVWGLENQQMLIERGFKTVLMGEGSTEPEYSTVLLQYYHKLAVIERAGNDYPEYIFLDWDCYLLKPLDDYFYQTLREGNDVQVTLYAYDDKPYIGIPELILCKGNERYNNSIPEDLANYIVGQEIQLRKYSWKHENLLVSPNFCFFYSRRPGIASELIQIAKENKVENCVEEHAMFLWANCTMDEFIEKYEPKVLQGTSDDTRIFMHLYDYENDPVIKINKYILQRVNKTIYFKHI